MKSLNNYMYLINHRQLVRIRILPIEPNTTTNTQQFSQFVTQNSTNTNQLMYEFRLYGTPPPQLPESKEHSIWMISTYCISRCAKYSGASPVVLKMGSKALTVSLTSCYFSIWGKLNNDVRIERHGTVWSYLTIADRTGFYRLGSLMFDITVITDYVWATNVAC